MAKTINVEAHAMPNTLSNQSSINLTSFAEVSNAFDAELPVKERIFEIWLDKFVGKFVLIRIAVEIT